VPGPEPDADPDDGPPAGSLPTWLAGGGWTLTGWFSPVTETVVTIRSDVPVIHSSS
jgi:hypothetical protein